MNHFPYIQVNQQPNKAKCNVFKNDVFTAKPEDAKRTSYNDTPSAKTDKLVTQLLSQSLGVYFNTATYAASTFLYGEADKSSFTSEVVVMMIKGEQMMNANAF